MKKILIIASVILLLVGGGIVYMIQKSTNAPTAIDSLTVEVSKNLLIQKVKIEYGFNSLNRKNDLDLFKKRERYITFFDGEMRDTIRTKYGENDFLVTYDSTYYLSFRQFKTWGKSAHSYHFLIHQEDSIPTLKVDIEGENEMHFDMPMILISEAHLHVVNTPVDDAGKIYNFLKLANPDIPEEQQERTQKEEEELIKKMNKLFQ